METYIDVYAREFDGVAMLLVPAGCFTIGTNPQEFDEDDGNEICFDKPFWIDRTEVSQLDFYRLGGFQADVPRYIGELRPIEQLTWFEAYDFCELRGGRLPTEAEWEYAARGPEAWEYPWGSEWEPTFVIHERDNTAGTAEVGTLPAGASWVGAMDMSGNVWEWTNSLYGIDNGEEYDFPGDGDVKFNYPYEPDDGREQYSESPDDIRIVRGGSFWFDDKHALRSGYRGAAYAVQPDGSFGFRCVRDLVVDLDFPPS